MEDYSDLMGGYSDGDMLQGEKVGQDMRNLQMLTGAAGSSFNEQDQENLILYQLETDRILERIEHFLRGDQIKIDEKGNSYFIATKDETRKNFNEYGVSELMRIISMYVTKETFLSRYDEERINEILGDLGDALADFIYCNMHKMGMDNKYKQSKFILIVLNILHEVESCYRRAIGGAEQENLRTRSIVTQSNSFGGGGFGGGRGIPQRKKFHPLKPGTW